MKAILEFNLEEPYEEQAHRRAVKSLDAYLAIYDIAQEIFRPHRKHGYSDESINKYLNHDNEAIREAVYDVIHLLEKDFYNILSARDINLDRDIS